MVFAHCSDHCAVERAPIRQHHLRDEPRRGDRSNENHQGRCWPGRQSRPARGMNGRYWTLNGRFQWCPRSCPQLRRGAENTRGAMAQQQPWSSYPQVPQASILRFPQYPQIGGVFADISPSQAERKASANKRSALEVRVNYLRHGETSAPAGFVSPV